ncbi:MAG: element excision factor XisI family protein [Candidatus Promineifilaceae bacterium]
MSINYRELLTQQLTTLASSACRDPTLQYHSIIDHTLNHYLLVCTGWLDIRRICATCLFVRLQDDKIWIEQDDTDGDIATQLQQAGVPYHHIVLAFHHPNIRSLTPYALE